MTEFNGNGQGKAVIQWLTPACGGRKSGPPGSGVYSTIARLHGLRDPRLKKSTHTIVLKNDGFVENYRGEYFFKFINKDLENLHDLENFSFVVLEGLKPVAHGEITKVY